MRWLSGLINLGVVLAAVAASGAGHAETLVPAPPPVYPGCAAAPTVFGHTYHVDPASQHGDGSRQAPFPTLAQAVAAAHGGDLISLAGGRYGAVSISGVNAAFVTVAAKPGQTPILSSLKVGPNKPASHWRFVGLTISGFSTAGLDPGSHWQTHVANVMLHNSDNVIFDRNTIESAPGELQWQPEVRGVDSPTSVATGVLADNNYCLAFVKNTIHNVFTGIAIGGNQNGKNGQFVLIKDNRIEDFAGDGIDHYAGHIIIQGNRITDGHDLCNDECIHHDGIQGWNYNNLPAIVNRDVVISENIVLGQTRSNLAFPAVNMQGITIFDGDWDKVRIVNNIIVCSTWHGLSVYGVRNAAIVNNTVLSSSPDRSAWIMVNSKGAKTDSTPYNVVVRNNISSLFLTGSGKNVVQGVRVDHNLKLTNARRTFVTFDPAKSQFDLHLARGSPARGIGSSEGAPGHDIEGLPRDGAIDAGAYAAQAR